MFATKCTTAVAAIARGMGKKIAKTGISTVPIPNPDKTLTPEIKNAVQQMITDSM
jgi:hypothetical protein